MFYDGGVFALLLGFQEPSTDKTLVARKYFVCFCKPFAKCRVLAFLVGGKLMMTTNIADTSISNC